MLRVPDFKDREAPRSQYSRQIRDNAAIIVETVGAREQRARGCVTGDIGHEWFVIRDIGRIAENEVELAADLLRPIPLFQFGTIGQSERGRIGPRIAERRFAAVDTEPASLRPLAHRRIEQRARSGAEVEYAFGPGAAKMLDCCIDQSLAVRPRDRSEEHTSELQSLMRLSYAGF